jgi:hypothetical protein
VGSYVASDLTTSRARQRERPIIFGGAMVRAILAGTKTQTRRLVTPPLPDEPTKESGKRWGKVNGAFYYCGVRCPYGCVGERLWVRETFKVFKKEIIYRADYPSLAATPGWTSPIFMPRRASRILLELVEVRVERVASISTADARAEGFTDGVRASPTDAFHNAWDGLHGAGAWARNYWVWALTVKVVR